MPFLMLKAHFDYSALCFDQHRLCTTNIVQPLGKTSTSRDRRSMCVVALAWKAHPRWPLILIGNRDEFHERPSASLAAWDDDSGILAGRDLKAGGTWLGVHPEQRRIVVVTNVRGTMPDQHKESRGQLAVDLLRGDRRFAKPVASELNRFNAFNLINIAGDIAEVLTNRPAPRRDAVEPGLHALANEATDVPCPRAERLKSELRAGIGGPGFAPDKAMQLLTSDDDPALFLKGDVYGTRASTLVAVDNNGRGLIVERQYEKGGRPIGTTALPFLFQ